jgi:hypothetical protein
MRNTTSVERTRELALRRRDAWDEDAMLEDDETGASWTKAYAGGVKTRQYTNLGATGARDSSLPLAV